MDRESKWAKKREDFGEGNSFGNKDDDGNGSKFHSVSAKDTVKNVVDFCFLFYFISFWICIDLFPAKRHTQLNSHQ